MVVQLAQVAGQDWPSAGSPDTLPAPRVPRRRRCAHVAHAVADLDDGLAQFEDLLGGRRVDEGGTTTPAGSSWPGRGRPGAAAGAGRGRRWRGGRRGSTAVRAGCTTSPSASRTPPASPAPSRSATTAWEVPPEDNLGVRLRLQPGPDGRASAAEARRRRRRHGRPAPSDGAPRQIT